MVFTDENVRDKIPNEGRILGADSFLRTFSVVWWSEFLATDPEARVRFPALPRKKK
jgi:hypothetical protein